MVHYSCDLCPSGFFRPSDPASKKAQSVVQDQPFTPYRKTTGPFAIWQEKLRIPLLGLISRPTLKSHNEDHRNESLFLLFGASLFVLFLKMYKPPGSIQAWIAKLDSLVLRRFEVRIRAWERIKF